MMITFEGFLDSKRLVLDLGIELREETLIGRAGWVYMSRYYIERTPVVFTQTNHATFLGTLMLGRNEWVSSDLRDLEQKLYAYMVEELEA